MYLVNILHLRLEDTAEDVIINHLRASASIRPPYCGLVVRTSTESRPLLAVEHPKSVLDGYMAAGRHALLHYVEDVRRLPVTGTPHSTDFTVQPVDKGPLIGMRLVLKMSDQEIRRLIRDRDDHHTSVTAKLLIQLICEERSLGGAIADYELSVEVGTKTNPPALYDIPRKLHYFRSEGDFQRYMNGHWADKNPKYKLWKRSSGDNNQQLASIPQQSVQEAPPPQYRLNASNNINVERYGMSHNRTYDMKGRPTTASGQESRQDFEERLVLAQNSILMTGARRLGRNNNKDEPAHEQVPDMPEDIES